MRRLVWVPALFAAGVAYGYWTGFLWPVAVTTARCWPRADAPGYEPEVL